MTIRKLDIQKDEATSEFANQLDPYENWDSRTLPDGMPPQWHSVYCALLRSKADDPFYFAEAARALKALLEPDGGARDPMTGDLVAPQATLQLLQDADPRPAISERKLDADRLEQAYDARFGDQEELTVQIYRRPPETGLALYAPLSDRTHDLIQVRRAFPAIPGMAERALRPVQAPEVDIAPIDAMKKGERREQKVITAIIDDEIGFLNARFRDTETSTRIKRFWSMAIEDLSAAPSVVNFGKVLDEGQINAMLEELASGASEAQLYAEFDEDLSKRALQPLVKERFRDPGYRRPRALLESHGTAVLDLAAGRAPNSEAQEEIMDPILAVELPQIAVAETNGYRLQSYILSAVQQILFWADTIETLDPPDGETARKQTTPLPVVINLSFGNHAGSKDGLGWLEQRLKRLIDGRNQTVETKLLMAAGNNRLSRGRAMLRATSEQSLDWRVQPDDATDSFIEFRTENAAGSTLALKVPELGTTGPIPLDQPGVYDLRPSYPGDARIGELFGTLYIQTHGAKTTGLVALAPTRPHTREGEPCALGRSPAPAGRYEISVSSGSQTPVEMILEAQRDDTPAGYATGARQSYFDTPDAYEWDAEGAKNYSLPASTSPIQRNGTLSAFVTAQSENIFVVGGAYSAFVNPAPRPAPYSSAGDFSWPARKTPSFATVSDDAFVHFGRLATGLYSGSSAVFSGTSMATALASREVVAHLRFGTQVHALTAQAETAGAPGAHQGSTPHELQLGCGVISETGTPGTAKRVPLY